MESTENLPLGDYYDELAEVAGEEGDFPLAVRAQRRAIELGCELPELAPSWRKRGWTPAMARVLLRLTTKRLIWRSRQATSTARIAGNGDSLPWPPGRNEPCWCGSSRKYKRCCA